MKNIFEAAILMSHFEDNPLLKKFKQEVQGQINFIGMVEGYQSAVFKEFLKKYKIKELKKFRLKKSKQNEKKLFYKVSICVDYYYRGDSLSYPD